eukprot:402969-Amorphochlora_amoeboformis.AAC.1
MLYIHITLYTSPLAERLMSGRRYARVFPLPVSGRERVGEGGEECGGGRRRGRERMKEERGKIEIYREKTDWEDEAREISRKRGKKLR